MTAAVEVVSSTPRPHFTPGKDSVPILQEAGWARGPVWTGGKSRPHRDSIPDCPAPSQSLYRLSYRAHLWNKYAPLNTMGFKIYCIGVRECSYEIYAFLRALTCDGAVGSGTAPQAGRLRVRFPMVSLELFIDILLPASL